VNRGHYTALVKDGASWVIANDAKIFRNGINSSRICTNNAYMLFYRWKILNKPDSTLDLNEYLEH
jgi:ubiquitin C-terminal hydrolase